MTPTDPMMRMATLMIIIIREDIFWGKGKNMSEATEEERMADLGERLTFDIIVIVILVIGIVVIGIS